MLKHYSRFAQESASGIGEKYPAAVAIEKSDADFALEILYLPAEHWLSNIKTSRRSCEVQLLGNHHEVPQVSKFHEADSI
ncbi:MAG: hypothetical protein WB460_02000 [Candidatus Acidiferrales bacterium]